MNSFEMFHREKPSMAMSEFYKYFQQHQPHKILHDSDKKKESWWDFLSPFSCDTEYEDESLDDGDTDDD
jgi:hypothetical protein